MPKVADLNALYPTNCEALLRVRNEYAGWCYHVANGYIVYSYGVSLKLYEHRIVAYSAYGEIPDGYHVHHADGNINNNAASNLTILSQLEHIQAHHPRVNATCDHCHKGFTQQPSQHRKSEKHYCSKLCKSLGERKVTRPSREQLIELLATLRNWCAIGQMFGVSDNAVRKWAKAYEIPTK